ncbi:hypothetical protein IL306_014595 [Fusarium sp. DS 682]|nr:hypothetical protein IL306_014595 [Fusarium sp. DS 682]
MCLDFLAYMDTKLKQSQVGQFLNVLLDPGQGNRRVYELKRLENTLFQAAQTCGTESIQIQTAKHTELLESLDKPLKRIDDGVERVLKALEENERQKALDSISTIPVGADHTAITDVRTEQTCEWLIRHAEFREWEESSYSSLFWLQGRIGTGKSFLTSKVIDRYRVDEDGSSHCLNQHDEGFAYFYCRRSDRDRQSIRPILQSFVRQLGEIPRRSGKIHKELCKLAENSKSVQKTFRLDDYKSALVEMINSYPRTTLVLDALDECDLETRPQLAGFLKELVEKSKHLLKVFVASRKESDIESSLTSLQDQQMLVEISAEDNKADIEKFVNKKLIEVKDCWPFDDKDGLEQLVKDTLMAKSDAMFRWTYLQCEQLKKCGTKDAVQTKLKKLPDTLFEGCKMGRLCPPPSG